MSTFEVKAVRIDKVYDNPDADRLSVVEIGGFRCISGKLEDGSQRYQAGDLVIYVPEGAVLPEKLLRREGFWNESLNAGMLAGSKGDRVKAIKLRGVVSQGILIGPDSHRQYLPINQIGLDEFEEGKDYAEYLGITKYVPEIPAHMDGSVTPAYHPGTTGNRALTLKFDVENGQKYTNIFQDGDDVVATEKLHGTFCAIAYFPGLNHPDFYKGDFFTYSKGLGVKGLVFQDSPTNRLENIYQKVLTGPICAKMVETLPHLPQEMTQPITFLGEVYGKGIQDLTYGTSAPEFRVFDIYVGEPGNGVYLNHDEVVYYAALCGLKTVPKLYEGKWHADLVSLIRDGKDSLSESNVREGVVVKCAKEIPHPKFGRRLLKFVSPDYLLRKGNATEYN